MRLGSSRKKIVQLIGCVTLCLIILSTAFLNRTLILEPLAAFLQRNCSFTEMKDRITENYLGDRFRGKNELLSLNGGFARLQGHTRYNNIQLMTNGMLTSTTTSMMNTSDFADSLSRLQRCLNEKGIPFLFIMAPYKLPTDENLLPTGAVDYANDIADQALSELKALGVPCLDLREDMSRTREQVEQYFYRTDHHWNAEACLYAFRRITEAVRDFFPETKMNFANPDLWKKTVLPKWWLGSEGRRVGPLFAGVDNLDYYLPSFKTEMARYSIGVWTCKGDFREANMREWLLEVSDYFTMDSYSRYLGGGYALTLHRNAQAENHRKLMIIRDSFMLPVECFLSTEFTSIDVIDPRMYSSLNETDYPVLNGSDIVILMVFPGIFPSSYYKFYANFPEGSDLGIIRETHREDLAVSGASNTPDYQELPFSLEAGKTYQLFLDHIQVLQGDPDGAQVALYQGEQLVDQTIFDIDYGNRYEYLWGFHVPESEEKDAKYLLRFYAGVNGGTQGMELYYQGIHLREYEHLK